MGEMRLLSLGALLTVVAVVGSGAAAEAAAKRGLKVTVTPRTVMAGNAITLGLSRTRGRTCRLSTHRDRFGAKARLKRKVVQGRTLIGIRSSTKLGRWRAVVRCGRRKASAGFVVVKASSGGDQGKAISAPALPETDEQGFVAGNSGTQE